MPSIDDFLARPEVAHVATAGPTVRPVWFLWEAGAFWWLAGERSVLARQLRADRRVALVVDTCDVASGQVLQVATQGLAEVVALRRDIARRALSKYLGPDLARWPERSLRTLDDPTTRLIRLIPSQPPVLRNLSYRP